MCAHVCHPPVQSEMMKMGLGMTHISEGVTGPGFKSWAEPSTSLAPLPPLALRKGW